MIWKNRLPTDLNILERIYEQYIGVFTEFDAAGAHARQTKVFVPIDIARLAADLRVHPDIILARLLHHLERRHGYKPSEHEPRVAFFVLEVGRTPDGKKDRYCINFPLMTSALAELQDAAYKHNVAIWISGLSLVISIVAFAVSVWP